DRRFGFDVKMIASHGRNAAVNAAVTWHPDRRAIDITNLEVSFDNVPWRLEAAAPPEVAWTDEEIAVTPTQFVLSRDVSQRVEIGGTWRRDGKGAVHVTATHVFLDTFQGAFEQPARYGGVLDADATISGTPDRPSVTGQLAIA